MWSQLLATDLMIDIFLLGVKNADENELRSIASDPDDIHMYNVNDFQFLLDIVDDLTVNLCNSVKGGLGKKGVKCKIYAHLYLQISLWVMIIQPIMQIPGSRPELWDEKKVSYFEKV